MITTFLTKTGFLHVESSSHTYSISKNEHRFSTPARAWYTDRNLKFRRWCTWHEAMRLIGKLIQYSSHGVTRPDVTRWQSLCVHTIVDETHYKPETGSNGGDYAFTEQHEFFVRTVEGRLEFGRLVSFYCSSDFEFDEIHNRHQSRLDRLTVVDSKLSRVFVTELGGVDQTRHIDEMIETVTLDEIGSLYDKETVITNSDEEE